MASFYFRWKRTASQEQKERFYKYLFLFPLLVAPRGFEPQAPLPCSTLSPFKRDGSPFMISTEKAKFDTAI